MTHLSKLLAEKGQDALWTTKEGHKYLTGAVNQLRQGAWLGAATVRISDIRDKLPRHIRSDILNQSYALLEMVGRCDVLIILISDDSAPAEMRPGYVEIFKSLYIHSCECEDSLKKLCKLAVETYAPGPIDWNQREEL
jgi:hypothetical protein